MFIEFKDRNARSLERSRARDCSVILIFALIICVPAASLFARPALSLLTHLVTLSCQQAQPPKEIKLIFFSTNPKFLDMGLQFPDQSLRSGQSNVLGFFGLFNFFSWFLKVERARGRGRERDS